MEDILVIMRFCRNFKKSEIDFAVSPTFKRTNKELNYKYNVQ